LVRVKFSVMKPHPYSELFSSHHDGWCSAVDYASGTIVPTYIDDDGSVVFFSCRVRTILISCCIKGVFFYEFSHAVLSPMRVVKSIFLHEGTEENPSLRKFKKILDALITEVDLSLVMEWMSQVMNGRRFSKWDVVGSEYRPNMTFYCPANKLPVSIVDVHSATNIDRACIINFGIPLGLVVGDGFVQFEARSLPSLCHVNTFRGESDIEFYASRLVRAGVFSEWIAARSEILEAFPDAFGESSHVDDDEEQHGWGRPVPPFESDVRWEGVEYVPFVPFSAAEIVACSIELFDFVMVGGFYDPSTMVFPLHPLHKRLDKEGSYFLFTISHGFGYISKTCIVFKVKTKSGSRIMLSPYKGVSHGAYVYDANQSKGLMSKLTYQLGTVTEFDVGSSLIQRRGHSGEFDL